MEQQPLIRVERLGKTYEHEGKQISVLEDLEFEVLAGEMIAITGASGAGKTTLLQVLGTLDNPTVGEITINGQNPFSLSDRARAQFRRRNIGFIFQFHHLLPQFTALENVAMPALIDREPTAVAEARARDLLDRMKLTDRLRHRPSELSGGEQQRVAVARALMMKPRVLLADEPTGNLDVDTGQGIHDLLVELNEEMGCAMIIVTHNPALADLMPRRLVLSEGQLHEVSEVAS